MEIKVSVNGLSSGEKKKYLIIGLNILLFISFFLPWVKTTSELAMGLSYFNLESVDGYMRLSPYSIIRLVNKLSEFLGNSTSEYQKIYVFLIIPIGAAINIITYFIKNEKSKIIQVITSGLVIVLALYVFSEVASVQDIGYFIKANIGFYLALLSSIGIIVVQFIKMDKLKKPVVKKIVQEVESNTDFARLSSSDTEESLVKEIPEYEQEGIIIEENTNDSQSEEESSFKKNTDQFVNFIKDDYSNKDKLHKSLLGFGIIVLIAMVLSIIFNNRFDDSILASIVSSVILLGIFAYSYFKMDFKLSDKRNTQILELSESLYGITDFMKSLDKNIFFLALGLVVVRFMTGYMVKSFDFAQSMYVINLMINTAIVLVLSRILALKDFKSLRNVFFGLGIMYLIMILRKSSYSYYWIDFKAAYMLWLTWIGFLFVETNYKLDK